MQVGVKPCQQRLGWEIFTGVIACHECALTLLLMNRWLAQDCHRGKKTLVLDLDETLVVSVPSSWLRSYEKVGFHFTVTPSTGSFHVRKRPGLDDFLRAIASHFEVVVWIAAMKEYACEILATRHFHTLCLPLCYGVIL